MVTTGAAKLQQAAWDEFSNSLRLDTAQKAVLDAIARLTPNYEPYGAEAMEAYQKVLGSTEKLYIQGAIKALQVRELVWQSARGAMPSTTNSFGDYYLRQMCPEPPNLALAGQSASRSQITNREIIWRNSAPPREGIRQCPAWSQVGEDDRSQTGRTWRTSRTNPVVKTQMHRAHHARIEGCTTCCTVGGASGQPANRVAPVRGRAGRRCRGEKFQVVGAMIW